MCCKPFSMLNDTCLIYLPLQQHLVEEQRKELKSGDGGVAATVALVVKQITAKIV